MMKMKVMNDKYNYNGHKPIYYTFGCCTFKIIIGFLIYSVLIILRTISNLELKRYMDLKYISPNKILIAYGLLGTLIYLAICITSSFSFSRCDELEEDFNYTKVNNSDVDDINISIYLCEVKINNTNTNHTEYYFENFNSFFSDFNESILRNIIVYLVGTIIFVCKEYFTLLIINFLTPIHVIFSLPIVFFFQKIIMICVTMGSNLNSNKYDTFIIFEVKNFIKYMKLLFDALGDIFSFFGFLIYLEVIKLCCYHLNYNCKTNIMRRSFGEVNRSINNDSFDNDEIIVINDDLEENEINE